MEKEKGILEHIDVVRWQDGKIHVLGRSGEKITSDGHSFRAHHIIHDAISGEMIEEGSFIHKGNFPLLCADAMRYPVKVTARRFWTMNWRLAFMKTGQEQTSITTVSDNLKKQIRAI